MRILVWHVHGGWMDAFVRGRHEYLLPVQANGDGGKGARPWSNAVDIEPAELRDADVDVVVLQRLEEIEEAELLLGRRPGRDVPAVFVEHNTPRVDVPCSVHPLGDRSDIVIVHVTHFNRLFWDCGRAPTTVIEHGIVDPGYRYTGELARLGAVINEPVRRWRVTGSDLLAEFGQAVPVDVFGMQAEGFAAALGVSASAVQAAGDLPTERLHDELGRRRAYLHPVRWTSLGLSLLEAMHLGMPVIALDTTEVRRAVPPEAGFVSTEPDELVRAAARLAADPDEARMMGLAARQVALERYGLDRFLADWDVLLEGCVARHRSAREARR